MVDELAERLKSHGSAFQSLLSLIPSKLYYAEEAQTQWKKRKQTPEERKEAKRAKLDPDQTNSAAGGRPVRVEKDENGEETELTRSQIKNRAKKAKKAQEAAKAEQEKAEQNGDATVSTEIDSKEVKTQKAKVATETVHATTKINGVPSTTSNSVTEIAAKKPAASTIPIESQPTLSKPNGIHPSIKPALIRKPSITNGIKKISPSPTNSAPRSPPIPIITSPAPEVPSPTSISELRARLAARISQSRIARKAIGTSVPGAPQTREAILQARQKRKARVEEKIRAKKEQLKTDLIPEIKDEESSDDEIVPSLKFGRVLINDSEIDAGKGQVKLQKKKKGPSDAKGRLEHLVKREERLSKLDPDKASKAIENDRWHSALLSARGEKVKDDPALLKKTIARREREKKKSTKAWDERIANVEKGKVERQRKRDDNLAKRREEKGKKGKKPKSKSGGKKPIIKKKRPGFEGGRVKVGRK